MIELESVEKSYETVGGSVLVLKGINLYIAKGEFVSVMGPSGSGKSTLAAILGCLAGLSTGHYRLDGTLVDELDSKALARLRNEKIGFIFQDFNLLDGMTAAENVALPLVYAGVRASERRKRALEALEKVNLGDRVDHVPKQLSGGQKQRVAIARALVNNPSLIFADEPTGALDAKNTTEVMGLLQRLNLAGQTVVQVTHSPEDALFSKRILHISDGQIVRDEFVDNYNVEQSIPKEKAQASGPLACLWTAAVKAQPLGDADVKALKRLYKKSDPVTVKLAAARALVRIKHPDLAQMLMSIFRHPHWVVRAELVKAADVAVHPQAIGFFIKGLSDPNAWIRYTSLTKLSRLNTSMQMIGGTGAVVACLGDADDRVRAIAVTLVQGWKTEELFQPIMQLAESDRCARVRANALEALVAFHSPERATAIEAAWRKGMADPHHRVSSSAAVQLRSKQAAEAMDTIRRLRSSKVAVERAAAAWALGRFEATVENGQALLEMAHGEDDELVRTNVSTALAAIARRGLAFNALVDIALGTEAEAPVAQSLPEAG